MPEVQRNGAAPPRVCTPRSAADAIETRKHKVVVETVTQEKKKLRSVLTFTAKAPLGYTFIPAGNPQLTNALKETARQENEKIFAVSTTPHQNVHDLSQQVHRIGFHFPNRIIDMVCLKYGIKISSKGTLIDEYGSVSLQPRTTSHANGRSRLVSEASEDQITINTKAREAITDLFPNIPDEDLWKIIKTAFQKGQHKVGTANELPLVRRAQLAVVAHIRHVYTDYDKLLRRGGYHTARTRVEKPTLEKLVAWRGDDENGSKMMEDVLKEVVVISDDESSEDEDEDAGRTVRRHKQDAGIENASSDDEDVRIVQIKPVNAGQIHTLDDSDRSFPDDPKAPVTRIKPISRTHGESSKQRDQRGFERYRHMAWNTAREHYRADPTQYARSTVPIPNPGDDRVSPQHSINTKTPYGERAPESKLIPVSRRVGLEGPHPGLPNDGRRPHSEARFRRDTNDPPQLVRLADGFLYERVAHPAPVRSRRSVTPGSPASPASRRRPGLESTLTTPVQSGNRPIPTNGIVERMRHDPETAIPSIEREETPDLALRRRDNFIQPNQATSHAFIGGGSQVLPPLRPVERLSDRVELIRLDGGSTGTKRRIDDAFPAEEFQIPPRKIYRPEPNQENYNRIIPGEGDMATPRSYKRLLEGRSANTSEVHIGKELQSPPRLIRQAAPIRKPQDASLHSATDHYSQHSKVVTPSSGPSSSRPTDIYYSRRSPERSEGTNRQTYHGIQSPVLSPPGRRTILLSRQDLSTQGEPSRRFGQHDPNVLFQGSVKLNPSLQRTLESGRVTEPHPPPPNHYDPPSHTQSQRTGSPVGSLTRGYPRPLRRINGDSSVDLNRHPSDVIFLGAASERGSSFPSTNKFSQMTSSALPRQLQDQQPNAQVKSHPSPEYAPAVEKNSATSELSPRRYILREPPDVNQRRYVDSTRNPATAYLGPARPLSYSQHPRILRTIDDSRVVRG